MKRMTIHAGHNPRGKIACGASDFIDESTENRWMCKRVKALLRKKGFTVYDTTVNNGTSQLDILQKIVAKCNAKKRDFDVSIHFNACRHRESDGKTTGVECHVYNLNAMMAKKAERICQNVAKLGFRNRGVYESKQLYVLRNTNKPCVLIEVCFVDDEDDARLYKKCKKEVAEAIADALSL